MIERYHDLPGGQMHTFEWHEAGATAPWLHFAHATGMNARLYRDILSPLAGQFRIVASDARGHGATTLPAEPAAMTGWSIYADDLGTLLPLIAPGPWWLAGHSMGAAVSAELAEQQPALVTGVLLIEPAFIGSALIADWAAGIRSNRMAEQAARRRRSWPSRAAIGAAYRGRGIFAQLGDVLLDAYLDGGLRTLPDGSVELACAPAWEAATFRAVKPPSPARWRCPLALHYGAHGSMVTPADAAAFAALLPGASIVRHEGAGHFLPLERPAMLTQAMTALIAADAGITSSDRDGN